MAKDLVRTRRYSQKFQAMKTQLQAVSLRIQVLNYSNKFVNYLLQYLCILLFTDSKI